MNSYVFFLVFCLSCLHSAGDGEYGAKCGGGSDAACGPLLVCKLGSDSIQRCVGNGEIGARCGTDSDCSGTNVCDTQKFVCRLPGTGQNGEPCTSTRDVKCVQACDSVSLTCRVSGDGTLDQRCGGVESMSTIEDVYCKNLLDLACDALGKFCRKKNIASTCGACVNGPCGGAGDEPCNTPLKCDADTYLCRDPGNGQSGAKCGGGDNCDTDNGLVCDKYAHTCRVGGTSGDVGDNCGSPGDVDCQEGNACDKLTHTCRAKGDGSVDSKCDAVDGKDEECYDPERYIFCDPETTQCRFIGHGNHGDKCDAKHIDDLCKDPLICDQAEKYCVGTGVIGAPCGYSNLPDTACVAGLECLGNVCDIQSGTLGGVCRLTEPRCDTDLGCKDNVCAPVGGLGGPCRSTEPSCDTGLECAGGECVIKAGTLGGACKSTEPRCGVKLSCGEDSKCATALEGAEWGACRTVAEESKCDNGLVCGTLLVCLKVDTGAAYITRVSLLLMIVIFACLL